MGKGFNNYMTKKFFHPASKDNIKRVWMAKQKTDYEKKKQDDLMSQYQREQEMLSNRALLGDEKAKMGLSFLYDAPPGMKSKEKEDNEPEFKFEWQRKYNAPREAYAKGDDTISDQPFGIEVRNIRCIKCRQWGHVNTDRICPLFGKNLTAEPPKPETSTSSLLEGLKEDGFQLKESMLGRFMASSSGEGIVAGDEEEDDPEVQFLKSLTAKQKKKLLKKLNVLQKNGTGKHGKAKKDKKKKKSKKKSHSSSNSDSSDDERQKKHKKHADSRNSSDEERYKAQGARPKKVKKEKDREGQSRKHRDRDSSDSDAEHGKTSKRRHDSDHRMSVKQEKHASVKQERRSRSPEPHSSKKKRSRSSSSSTDSSTDRHREDRSKADRRDRSGSPVGAKADRHRDRKDRSGSPLGAKADRHRDRKDRSGSPLGAKADRHRDRKDRSGSPLGAKADRHRDRRDRSRSPARRERERSSSRDRQRTKHLSKHSRDSR